MNKDKEIEKEVDKTLRSLDHIKKAKTDAYFYARLEERLNSRDAISTWDIWASLWKEPRYLLGALSVVLIIFVNVYSVIQYDHLPEWDSATNEEVEHTLAEEYIPDLPILYND